MAKKEAAGRAFTIRSRARICAQTASTKYTVNIAVVSRANAGIRLAESNPITEAALEAGSSQRMSCGISRASSVFAIGDTGIAHATASAAWNAARPAYVFGEVRPLMSLIQFGWRRKGSL